MLKRNIPLRCRLVERVLTIEIGVDTLKHAAERCDEFWLPETDKAALVVSNSETFAKDVQSALTDEGEDGSTAITHMLDAAIKQAVEWGSEGLDYDAMDALEEAERVAVNGPASREP